MDIKPLSREEWERTLEDSIKAGLSRRGETYEEYLGYVSLWYGSKRKQSV